MSSHQDVRSDDKPDNWIEKWKIKLKEWMINEL